MFNQLSLSWRIFAACLFSGWVAAGCSTTTPASKEDGRGSYKVGRTYTVMGQTYTPHEDLEYSEKGQASWYGPGFHGRYTANGEIYNQHERTGAHRTLPMPSVVLVTNLDNGLSTMVRINDRGPFAHNRIIDLSRKAAEDLQMVGPGVANVRVDILKRESEMVKELAIGGAGPVEQMAALVDAQRSRPAPPRASAPATSPTGPGQPSAVPAQAIAAAPQPTGFFVQAGAYGSRVNAERARDRVQAFGTAAIAQVTVNGQELYRLRIGPITDPSTADQTLSYVQRAGFSDARVVIE